MVDLSPLLSSLPSGVSDIQLKMDAVTASASETVNAVPTGTGTVADVKVIVTLSVLGIPTQISSTVTVAGTPNEDLLTDVTSAIAHNGALAAVANLLSTALSGAITLTSNYQSPASPAAGGTLKVSGIHIGVLNDAALSADIGTVTVGPNTSSTTPATPPSVTVKETVQG